jgi:DNA-binding CsgD family transcriptional regulator
MDTLAPPRRQLRPAHWIAIDCAFTALMLLVYIELRAAPFLRGIPSWAAIVIVLVAVVPAAFRRRRPSTVLVMVVAAGAVASALSSSPAPPLAAAFVMYLIPLRFPRRDALWLLAPAVTRRLIEEFIRHPEPQQRPAVAVDEITEREREVLTLVGLGLSNAEIAAHLHVSLSTAKTHVGRLLMKLGARDRAQLVIAAYNTGLVRPP